MEISEEIKTSFKSARHKALVNIRYTSNWMGQRQHAYMAQFDLTMPQFNILRILRGANDFLSVNTIKDRMIEKSPNTTRLMDKLIEKELIERVRCDQDRRVVYVKISEKGLALLTQIDNDFEESHLFTKTLTEAEAEELSRLLDKVRC